MTYNARLSECNQVVEVFEKGKYNIQEVYPNEIIKECDSTVKPLDWYIEGIFVPNKEYKIPIVQVYDDTVNGLTIDQLIDVLKWQGVV